MIDEGTSPRTIKQLLGEVIMEAAVETMDTQPQDFDLDIDPNYTNEEEEDDLEEIADLIGTLPEENQDDFIDSVNELIDGGESPRTIKNLLNNAIYNEVMNLDIDTSIF